MKRASLIAILVALSGRCNVAEAQNVDSSTPTIGSLFARNRSVTVSERIIPGYERAGIDVEGFNVRPEVFAGTFVTDNLYATEVDRQSDVAFLVSPSVTALLDGSRTRVSLTADAQFNRYLSRDTENSSLYSVRGTGRQELGGGFTVGVETGYRRQAERRSDPGAINTTLRPILYDAADAGGNLQWEGGRLRLRGTGSVASFTFRNGVLPDGTPLLLDFRDRTLYRYGATGDYALTANTAVRVQANYARSNYNVSAASGGLDRSSRRLELLGGVSFEFTDLLRGEIGLGFIDLKYDSPVFQAFSGFGGRVQVEYLPTPLTTITFRASRTIEEAGLPLSPAYLRTAVSITADHELYRNVIISGYLDYSNNRFRQPDRSDRRPSAGASARYRMSRTVSLIARYDYLHASSSPANLGRNISLNSGSLGINVGL